MTKTSSALVAIVALDEAPVVVLDQAPSDLVPSSIPSEVLSPIIVLGKCERCGTLFRRRTRGRPRKFCDGWVCRKINNLMGQLSTHIETWIHELPRGLRGHRSTPASSVFRRPRHPERSLKLRLPGHARA